MKILNVECEVCGSRKNLVYHHESYDPEIIQVLCKTCHRMVHKANRQLVRPEGFVSKIKSIKKEYNKIIMYCDPEIKLDFLRFKLEGKFSNNEKALVYLLNLHEASKVKFK